MTERRLRAGTAALAMAPAATRGNCGSGKGSEHPRGSLTSLDALRAAAQMPVSRFAPPAAIPNAITDQWTACVTGTRPRGRCRHRGRRHRCIDLRNGASNAAPRAVATRVPGDRESWATLRRRVFQTCRPNGTGSVRPTGSDGLARGLLLPRPGGDVLQQGLADLILPWFHLSGLPDEGDGGHALAGLVA
jgi:hypothetical protein